MRKILSASLLCSLAIPAVISAQTVTPTSGTNTTADWLQDWNGGSASEGGFTQVPQDGDGTVIINNNRVIEVTTAVTTVAPNITLNNTSNSGNVGTLNVNAGGSLTSGLINVGGGNDEGVLNVQGGTLNASGVTVTANNASNVVNVTSGTLDLGTNQLTVNGGNVNVNGGTLKINVNTNGSAVNGSGGGLVNQTAGTITIEDNNPGGGGINTAVAGSVFNLSGGKFEVTGATIAQDVYNMRGTFNISGDATFEALGGQVRGTGQSNGDTVFNITGSNATILMDRANFNTDANGASFNFIFDETGISTVGQNLGYVSLGGVAITIDGSAYTGGVGTFDLFSTNNIATSAASVTLSGFHGVEGVDYFYEDSTTGNYSRLVITSVPEPSVYTLLAGLTGLAYVMIRRRRN